MWAKTHVSSENLLQNIGVINDTYFNRSRRKSKIINFLKYDDLAWPDRDDVYFSMSAGQCIIHARIYSSFFRVTRIWKFRRKIVGDFRRSMRLRLAVLWLLPI